MSNHPSSSSGNNNNSSSNNNQGDSILRKLNPMKLLDAGASAISGAVRSGGTSVSDRITSLLRRDETGSTTSAAASHSEVIQAYSTLRCTVQPAEGTTTVENAAFNINLLDKRNNMPVIAHPVTRKWKECESVLSMISSLFPRLEGLPPPPGRSTGRGGAAAHAEIDERRRYVQQCLTVMFVHSGAAGTKDLQKFLRFGAEDGLGTLQPHHQHGSNPVPAAAAFSSAPPPQQLPLRTLPKQQQQQQQQQQSSSTPVNATSSGDNNLPKSSSNSNLSRVQSSSQLLPETNNNNGSEENSLPEHFDEKELIFDVFHLVDDDGSGWLDTDELEPFFSAIPKNLLTREQIDQCLLESDKEQTGNVDIRNFRSLCTHLVTAAKKPLIEIVRPFRSQHIARLYEALSINCVDDDPPPMEIQVDRDEAKVLLLVITNVGLRAVTPAEVARQELVLPMALTEFDSIMDALLYSMSFSELLKALAGGKEGSAAGGVNSRVLKLINRVAARAHPKALKLLKERIAKACPESAVAAAMQQQTLLAQASSGNMLLSSCSGCDQMKKQISDLEKQLAEVKTQLAAANDERNKDGSLGNNSNLLSPSMSPKVSDLIRAQLDEAVTELEMYRQRVDQLENIVAELSEENKVLKEKREKEEQDRVDHNVVDAEELGFTGNEAFLRSNANNNNNTSGGGGNAFSTTTLYLLPSNIPSSGLGGDGWRRGVIDRAGALTYQGFAKQQQEQDFLNGGGGGDTNNNSRSTSEYTAADSTTTNEYHEDPSYCYRPMGWTVDMYLVDAMGVEHMACRDKIGRRSIAWTIERGKLVCPWSRTVIAQLPVGKWMRLTAQIHWAERYVSWVLDGKTVVKKQPFRDAQAEDITTLDLYPRSSLVACYANMRFFR